MADDMSLATVNARQGADRVALSAINSPDPGSRFENLPFVAYSTFFWNPAATVTDAVFFSNTSLDQQWQTPDFPSQTQGFLFFRCEIVHNIRFLASNILRNTQTDKYFFEQSLLNIKNEGYEVITNLSIDKLVKEKFVLINNVAGVTATYQDIAVRFNNEYVFQKPIAVAAGEKPQFKIVAAAGLTTATWDATVDPVLGNMTGAGMTDPTKAYYVTLKLIGQKAKVKK